MTPTSPRSLPVQDPGATATDPLQTRVTITLATHVSAVRRVWSLIASPAITQPISNRRTAGHRALPLRPVAPGALDNRSADLPTELLTRDDIEPVVDAGPDA